MASIYVNRAEPKLNALLLSIVIIYNIQTQSWLLNFDGELAVYKKYMWWKNLPSCL